MIYIFSFIIISLRSIRINFAFSCTYRLSLAIIETSKRASNKMVFNTQSLMSKNMTF